MRAVARPQVDDGVGRRVVLGPRAFARTCASSGRRTKPIAPAASDRTRSSNGARRGFGLARDELAAAASASAGNTRRSTNPARLRLVGAQRLAGEHHLHGGAHAGEAHRADRAAETRMDAQHHFREADREFVALDADAIAAGQRQLQAAAERKAVNDGHAWGRASASMRAKIAVRATHHFLGLRRVREPRRIRLHVGTGDEAIGFAGTDDQAARRRTLERLQVRCRARAGCHATARWSKCRACRTSARRCRRHRSVERPGVRI